MTSISLRGELLVAVLALVAVYVKALLDVQLDHHSNRLLHARLRYDRLVADATTRSVLLVEVLHAVNLAVGRQGERYVVEDSVAFHAPEAVWMEGFLGGAKDAIHDGFLADAALVQSVQIVFFAIRRILIVAFRSISTSSAWDS